MVIIRAGASTKLICRYIQRTLIIELKTNCGVRYDKITIMILLEGGGGDGKSLLLCLMSLK